MTWDDLQRRPVPRPAAQISYGSDPLQHVDLWLPASGARRSVVLMVHGGCWQTDIADATLMDHAADALCRRGIAVWNIEYRGVDRPGGGYPGTFRDVAAAADMLGTDGARHGLDTTNVVVLGHSAGGHLGMWLAARESLPRDSILSVPCPLKISTAISVGGLPDLEAAQTPPGDTCGREAVHRLTGTATAGRPDVYRDTSPAAMMPFSARQVFINAERDHIAPPGIADAYEQRARSHGVAVRRIVIPDEGHVELIAPGSAAWACCVSEIEAALALEGLA